MIIDFVFDCGLAEIGDIPVSATYFSSFLLAREVVVAPEP